MNEVRIWTLEDGSQAKPLEPKGQTESEQLLEDILVKNPELLMPSLTLVGRQTETEGGPLDLLGVDSDGRLVLFELKRGALSRDAVAQIIDYASDLEAMDLDALASHIAESSGKRGIDKIEDFEEWYSQEFDGQDLESMRPLRMFLVGLGADARTERMVTFLARGIDISLLTFHSFVHDGKTFLAKQVHVEGIDDLAPRSTRRRPTRAEMMQELLGSVQEPELFAAVRDMFSENWRSPSELGGRYGISLGLRGTYAGKRRSHQYARIDPKWPGVVVVVFYPKAVGLCLDEFIQFSQKIPYRTYPREQDLEKGPVEVNFDVTPDGWEAHKEALHALTKSVYAAWEREREEEESA